MNRSSVPKSETSSSRTVRKDGGTCNSLCCIESGDDLGPFCFDFGLVDWVGVDGRLTGVFFHCVLWLVQGCEEEIFIVRPPPMTTSLQIIYFTCHPGSISPRWMSSSSTTLQQLCCLRGRFRKAHANLFHDETGGVEVFRRK
jgi:hypothetical protein